MVPHAFASMLILHGGEEAVGDHLFCVEQVDRFSGFRAIVSPQLVEELDTVFVEEVVDAVALQEAEAAINIS